MSWSKNITKTPRKVMHVDCGDCKRYRKDCKASYNYYVWNRDDKCMLCVPNNKKKPPRKYDNVNRLSLDKKQEIYARSKKVSTEEKRAIAIMAARPSARQGNGHK